MHQSVDVGDALMKLVVLHIAVVSDEVTSLIIIQGVNVNLGSKDRPRDKGAEIGVIVEEILISFDSISFPRVEEIDVIHLKLFTR